MDEKEFDEFVQSCIQQNQTVVLKFEAEWCGPCKAIAPLFDRLTSNNPKLRVIKVDVQQHEDLVARYRVKAMPTFYALGPKGTTFLVGSDPQQLTLWIEHLTS
jgi:thiol-disulfide isomerase/thioredoxin